jgi:biopolymer transport protein ExbB/TolQ
MHGLVDRVLAADTSNLSAAMFALFLFGLAVCGWRIAQTSRDLNGVRSVDEAGRSRAAEYLQAIRGRNGESRALLASAFRLKLTSRLALVRQIASALVLIGLVGTVVGFIVVLSGVKPDQAADVAAVGPMVATLVEGMGIALYTTLVGAVLNIWLTANCHLLSGGLVKLLTRTVEAGERHARA